MSYEQEIELHLVGVVRQLCEETYAEMAEKHPFHATAIAGGLKHTSSNVSKNGKTTEHTYMPDHHWKSAVRLVTTQRKGSTDKHEWNCPSNWSQRGKDKDSLKNFLDNDKIGYDRMVDDHKHGRGQFK